MITNCGLYKLVATVHSYQCFDIALVKLQDS